jgi:hypothetical protein
MTGPIKIALAVRADLESWQKMNVAAFLPSGFGSSDPSLMGEDYVDADGLRYPPMLAYPVRVFTGDAAGLRRSFDRALSRGLLVAVYTDQMFTTMNDSDNRAAVGDFATPDLEIAGFAVAGDAKQVDKTFDKLKLHR